MIIFSNEGRNLPQRKRKFLKICLRVSAIAQAGIYTIGQLAKMPEDLQVKRIATIILYKDLSAQVALASLDPAKASSTGSIGAVSYKLLFLLYSQEGSELPSPVSSL